MWDGTRVIEASDWLQGLERGFSHEGLLSFVSFCQNERMVKALVSEEAVGECGSSHHFQFVEVESLC